ncbi:hypothetical protein A9Q99_23395 [Gammaproteobacteria bacterium 45_16_T64]|nr:hypothetical protein A9Q99_23395 [Gammaproteobacteria bacterium 45_16_T64]
MVSGHRVEPVVGSYDQDVDPCHFTHWRRYQGTELYKNDDDAQRAYFFVNDQVAVDAGGAPNAYHPEDKGLDYLVNAGYPDSTWWPDVLVSDPKNQSVAYLQPSGEFEGYFISKTTLEDQDKSVFDVQRYVDATTVPYVVFPSTFYKQSGTGLMGDIGVAIHLSSGKMSGFVVADVDPGRADLGEMSIKLAESLSGKTANPKNEAGAPKGEILYILFPYSAREHPWPLNIDAIQRIALSQLKQVGGKETVVLCSAKEFDPE